ncbi:MAG: MFS transporter [Pseudomonadota bacterium]|nr:MFS transporter [Pseudomonadota bacterium]
MNTTTLAALPRAANLAMHYRWYVLALLWCVALLRFVDMQILAVLLEPIRAEFQLNDTQLALLGGLAFALFYGVLGLPVAWLADRVDRRAIIAAAVTLWSLMTALCGFATSFAALFLARIGVGIGEAGAYPPSTSLLADYFPPQQRGRACAILASAIPAGVFVGFLVGGTVSVAWGWRAALMVVGLPGILLGLLTLLTVREPPRGGFDDVRAECRAPPFRTCLASLWREPAYRHVVFGACLFTLGATGSGIWIASYFIRHHGFSGAQIGTWLAFLYGGGGMCGALLGGWLGQRCGRYAGDASGFARVCCWSLLGTLPFAPLVFLNPAPYTALLLHLPIVVLMHMNTGPVLTLIQQIAGPARRAVAHAVSVLISNVVALPLGPLLVGMFSDRFTPLLGTQALGIAIAGLLVLAWAWAAWHFNHAARHIHAGGAAIEVL